MEVKIKPYLYIITFLLWSITLIFRFSYLETNPHINNVAHIFLLQTTKIWQEENPICSNFSMKHTYSGSGDKFVTYYVRYQDKEGNNYYVSHPSLTQGIAWIISGFGRFEISNRVLMMAAMIIQLFTAFFLLKFVRLFVGSTKYSVHAQLGAVLLYLFHPAVLYLTTFHFFAESIGQFFFVLTSYYLYRVVHTDVNVRRTSQMILFALGFLFASAEWLGVFYAASLLFLILFKRKSSKSLAKPALAIISGTLLALVVFFLQHITLNNAHTFIRALGIRFLERSGFFGNEYTSMGYSYINPDSYVLLIRQLGELFSGTGFVFVFVLVFLTLQRKLWLHSTVKNTRLILTSIILTCLVHFVILFSASITHYVYIAKWVLPLIMFVSILTPVMIEKLRSTHLRMTGAFILIFLLIWSVWIFRKKADLLELPDPFIIELAEHISSQTKKHEQVFCSTLADYPTTAIIWLNYASGRNIAIVGKEEDICTYLPGKTEQYAYYFVKNKSFSTHKGKCGEQERFQTLSSSTVK